jgi:hypothetical protein
MHGPIKVKSPNNTNKWQMGFNSAFKGLITTVGLTLEIITIDLNTGKTSLLFFGKTDHTG